LEPASPDLWACLGAAAPQPAVREYALSRALTLDPKRATCWAALGRWSISSSYWPGACCHASTAWPAGRL